MTATDDTLEAQVGTQLSHQEETVSTAESCTGGLLAARLTDVPGASDYFEFGMVTYAYGTKLTELGVNRELLDEHGVVSAETATAMAQGIRDRSGSTWGLATTGVAGPTGGTAQTPVGTVYIGLAYAAPWDTEASWAVANRYQFDGSRTEIKEKVVTQALTELRVTLQTRNDAGDAQPPE